VRLFLLEIDSFIVSVSVSANVYCDNFISLKLTESVHIHIKAAIVAYYRSVR